MKIKTGNGTIPLITLIAIWSISLVVNLPGLAISPILNNIAKIFPNTSQLEIQLLTILPNLFIIPFVLLSGKLSVSRDKTKLLIAALVIYIISGVLYFFANSMAWLIIISCLLGIGCGLLIPLAAGLIADFFIGKYRMKQLGIKSGIANVSLVLATFAVGWLDSENWHLPFLVYLIPIVPLALTPFLWGKRGEPEAPRTEAAKKDAKSAKRKGELERSKLLSIVGLYGFTTYSVIVISYYLPFLGKQHNLSDSTLGVITSLFFLAVMLPGFLLPVIVHKLKQLTSIVMLSLMAMGLGLILIWNSAFGYSLGAILMGISYGTIQPIIYDKATQTATGKKSTLALSIVLAMNYIAITVTPFIIDSFKSLFDTKSNSFPFLINFIFVLGAIVLCYFKRGSFAFNTNKEYE